MPTYRAQVVLPMFTGLPSDVVTNTFHFNDAIGTVGYQPAIDAMTPALQTFYQAVYLSPGTMATYMRPALALVNWYNLAEPPPRAPTTVPMPMPSISQSDSNIPNEVSIVLSFEGERISGQPQSRRRGRIYLGGLGIGWYSTSQSTSFSIVSSNAQTRMANAATALRDSPPVGLQWAVWSQVDAAPVNITGGWIDAAIDTQRRRGVASSGRVLWPIP